MTARLLIATYVSSILILLLATAAEFKSKSLISKVVRLGVTSAPNPDLDRVREELLGQSTTFARIGLAAAATGTILMMTCYRLLKPTTRFIEVVRSVSLALLVAYTLLAIITV